MTWKTYTKAIHEAELESGTQAQILIKLFKGLDASIRRKMIFLNQLLKSGLVVLGIAKYLPIFQREKMSRHKIYIIFLLIDHHTS